MRQEMFTNCAVGRTNSSLEAVPLLWNKHSLSSRLCIRGGDKSIK